MSKIISEFPCAEVIDVRPVGEADGDWGWRTDFIGFKGRICFYESEKYEPGMVYVYMNDDISDFKTSSGIIEINDKTVTLTTKNTEYVFEILENNAESGEAE